MKLDQTIIDRVLGDFATLIKSAAESSERGRFHMITELARHAQDFQRFNGARVDDFDKPGTIDLGYQGAVIGGHPVNPGGGFGDQAEMIRTLIDSIKDLNTKRQSPAQQLKDLLDVRAALKQQSTESTDDIDQQINRLREEIVNGTIADVVHPQLLRGSAAEEGRHDDGVVVGERDTDRTAGPAVVVRTCDQQAVDERD